MSEQKIWNQGFPSTTSFEDAAPLAVAAMVDFYAAQTPSLVMVGEPTSVTDASTEEHIEAGERLVCVVAEFDVASS